MLRPPAPPLLLRLSFSSSCKSFCLLLSGFLLSIRDRSRENLEIYSVGVIQPGGRTLCPTQAHKLCDVEFLIHRNCHAWSLWLGFRTRCLQRFQFTMTDGSKHPSAAHESILFHESNILLTGIDEWTLCFSLVSVKHVFSECKHPMERSCDALYVCSYCARHWVLGTRHSRLGFALLCHHCYLNLRRKGE